MQDVNITLLISAIIANRMGDDRLGDSRELGKRKTWQNRSFNHRCSSQLSMLL